MRRVASACFSVVPLLLLCLWAPQQTRATVFRDRAAFEAAAQNLRTLDFENQKPGQLPFVAEIDGIRFENFFGPTDLVRSPQTANIFLDAGGVGEITQLTIFLPPGTTAVGCDQFSRPMEAKTSTGESVTMTPSDTSNFVGFVSDVPIARLVLTLDFPEPTPEVLMDNLTYGQRRAGNEPPKPLLLTDATTGRAAAFDSVALTAEPFTTGTPPTRNLSADGRPRVTLLVVGVRLDAPGEEAFVTARAVDSQQRAFDLPVEGVGGVKNLSWLGQVTVRLPDELSGAGDVTVTVNVRGALSNGVTLRVD
jgi:hypothetical protein